MASERERGGLLATWVGGQIKSILSKLALLRNGNTSGLTPKIYTASGTTTAAGAVSFTIPSGYFTTLAWAGLVVVRDTATATAATFVTIRTRSTTSVTAQVWESKTTPVLVLNTSVEGLEPSAAGITVELVAIGT